MGTKGNTYVTGVDGTLLICACPFEDIARASIGNRQQLWRYANNTINVAVECLA